MALTCQVFAFGVCFGLGRVITAPGVALCAGSPSSLLGEEGVQRMDLHQLIYGLSVMGLILAAPLLGRPQSLARRLLGRQLSRLGVWVLAQVRPEPHADPAAEEWFRLLRREQLRVDLRRLQLLLVTDMHMSATRQLGNRLAYDSVLRDLTALRALLLAPTEAAVDSWQAASMPTYSAPTWGSESRRGSNVETLEISWRS